MTTPARLASLTLLLFLPTTALAAEAPPERGLSLQPHLHRTSGWTIRLEERDVPTTEVKLEEGAGVGLRLGYDFTPYVGAFASAEFDVESEGPYTGYGAGLVLRSPMLGPVRLHARAGGRWLSPVGGLFYGTVGVGAEVFVFRRLSLGIEADVARPIADGTRLNARVEADGGPLRGLAGLTWYFGS